MNQGTAVYTVRVRDQNGDFRLLGDIDGGAHLGARVAAWLHDFESVSSDKTMSIRCAEPFIEGDDTFLVLEHRQSGVAGDIVDKYGRLRMRVSPDDTQRTKYAALFRLPRPDITGYLAAQVRNGCGVEALLEEGIQARFGIDFPRLVLEIWPFVPGSVFRRVMEEDGFKSTKFVRYEQPTDRAVAAGQRWVKAGAIGRLGPSLTMFDLVKRTRYLLPRQSARDEARAHGEIVELRGGTAAGSRVEMEQGDGTRRNFFLHQSGPAFTEEMASLQMEEGVATDASLLAELRNALRDTSC